MSPVAEPARNPPWRADREGFEACQVVGLLAWHRGDHGEAPIALRREVFGPESSMLAESPHYLASCYAQAGRTDEAIAAYEEALEIARDRPGQPPNWRERDVKTLERLRARRPGPTDGHSTGRR